MNRSFDVIVLGVGAMGAAACSALARRGARVLGIEQHQIPHQLGSSGGQTRLIRTAYFEHPDYVPLLHRAYALWDQLGNRAGAPVLHRTGLVCAGPEDGTLIAGTLHAAREHALRIERLTAADVASRAAPLRIPERFVSLLDPDGGLVLCERAIAAFADEATDHGAILRSGTRVRGWDVDGAGVEVETVGQTFRADRLIVTAGAWAGPLLAGLGVDLQVTRQVIGWTAPTDPARFALGAFPCWAIEDDVPGFDGLYYGFPIVPAALADGPRGTKAGHHRRGPPADPDAVDRRQGPADERDFRAGLEKFVPAAAGPTADARVCLYTMSPDGHFVVDRHPTRPQVVVATGFSGHGFKFAPVIGDALADLALDGRTGLPIGFLGLSRFG